MKSRFDVVAYKNIGDNYPSVHLGIPANRVKRLLKNLKELGYVQIVTEEVTAVETKSVLSGGLGGRRG